tara:strand:+ start:1280 stop:1594 length:315 start_codon:yes stop_codon:yes gene_type:complete
MIWLFMALTIPSLTYADALDYAPEIYKEHSIGELLDPYSDCYGCDDVCRVSARPLYNDAGLPLYEIFDEENFKLVGYEFRINKHSGFSIELTMEQKFIYMIFRV